MIDCIYNFRARIKPTILTSLVAMYSTLGLNYLNLYLIDQVYYAQSKPFRVFEHGVHIEWRFGFMDNEL